MWLLSLFTCVWRNALISTSSKRDSTTYLLFSINSTQCSLRLNTQRPWKADNLFPGAHLKSWLNSGSEILKSVIKLKHLHIAKRKSSRGIKCRLKGGEWLMWILVWVWDFLLWSRDAEKPLLREPCTHSARVLWYHWEKKSTWKITLKYTHARGGGRGKRWVAEITSVLLSSILITAMFALARLWAQLTFHPISGKILLKLYYLLTLTLRSYKKKRLVPPPHPLNGIFFKFLHCL